MNWSTLQGNWNEAKGKVKTQWGRLTDDDLTQVQGQKDRLVGVIQQKYGIARDKAEQQLEEFMSASDGLVAKAKEGAQEVLDKGREYVDNGREFVHRGVEQGREFVQRGVDQGREFVQRGVDQGREVVEQGRSYVQNTSTSDMASDLKHLIGRNPVQSTIIGIGLGFLIGRLLTSSNRS